MNTRGPKKKVTPNDIIQLMENGDRPVWTASDLADRLGMSRPPIRDRLKELEDNGRVETLQVGNAKAYHVRTFDPESSDHPHYDSLIQEFTNKFVGIPDTPWTAISPDIGSAEAGDKVQIYVEGTPGTWTQRDIRTWENRRDEISYSYALSNRTQALVSGELYSKPTVPIEHIDYDEDYDLEEKIGGEYITIDGLRLLVAAGPENYLIKPCNNAVFLSDISVDWISPKGHGNQVSEFSLPEEVTEKLHDIMSELHKSENDVDPPNTEEE